MDPLPYKTRVEPYLDMQPNGKREVRELRVGELTMLTAEGFLDMPTIAGCIYYIKVEDRLTSPFQLFRGGVMACP